MDAKLAEYRSRKRKEAAKNYLYNMITLKSQPQDKDKLNSSVSTSIEVQGSRRSESSLLLQENDDTESITSDTSDVHITCPKFTWFTFISYSLYILLWTTLFAIAVILEFGTVYLIISFLYAIWINTRTGPKKQGEVSAYSVFNPNCEAIDGTLKAEQFEREIRYGAASVH